MNHFTTIALIAGLAASTAVAGPFDGIFRPDYPFADTWSCSAEFIGMDGGAVAIEDGYIYGVESACRLTNPRPVSGQNAVRYLSMCSAEGTEYSEDITVARTDNGVSITRGDHTSYWKACENTESDDGYASSQANLTTSTSNSDMVHNVWQYRGGTATVVTQGLALSLSCEMLNPSSTYPTANLVGYCPMCGVGDEMQLRFSVDGRYVDQFDFVKRNNAEGYYSPLYYYSVWHDGLIPALMSGQELKISIGANELASMSLTGSSKAIEQLRRACN